MQDPWSHPKAKYGCFLPLHVDGYYLLATKSALSRLPKFSKDCPTMEAGREGGEETVPSSRKQACVHPDGISVGHVSLALGPDDACAGPDPHPQKTAQTLCTSPFLLPKRKSPFKNEQAQTGDREFHRRDF